jgi:hypothetical protein
VKARLPDLAYNLDMSSAAILATLLLAGMAGADAPAPDAPKVQAPASARPAPVPLAAPSTKPPELTFTGKKFPPPGSPADQALLGELLVAQGTMLNQRAWAIKATSRLHDGAVDERLAALQAGQPPEQAGKTEGLRVRLTTSWKEVSEVMTRQWLVDGRIGCRPQAISFEVLMGPAEGQTKERLAAARESARKCMERQMLMVRPLTQANRALDAAWRDADAALAAAPGNGAGTAGAQAGGGK